MSSLFLHFHQQQNFKVLVFFCILIVFSGTYSLPVLVLPSVSNHHTQHIIQNLSSDYNFHYISLEAFCQGDMVDWGDLEYLSVLAVLGG